MQNWAMVLYMYLQSSCFFFKCLLFIFFGDWSTKALYICCIYSMETLWCILYFILDPYFGQWL